MKHRTKSILLALLLTFSSCTDGGGDDDSGNNGGSGGDGDFQSIDNACSAIGLNQRIINGEQCVSEVSSPVVRVVLDLSNGNEALCTGTMITSRHVLTAAHCFVTRPTGVGIQVGNQLISATQVNVHPDFKSGATSFGVEAGFNDVAIIELSREPGLPTLPILISKDIESGSPVAIYGYGLDEDGGVGILRGGTATISDITTDHFTTKFDGDGSNTCEGDSGGPALVNTSQGLSLIGVTSSGTVKSCGPGDLSIYANVQSSSIINFIQDVVPGARII